jgi:hypothetical protein
VLLPPAETVWWQYSLAELKQRVAAGGLCWGGGTWQQVRHRAWRCSLAGSCVGQVICVFSGGRGVGMVVLAVLCCLSLSTAWLSSSSAWQQVCLASQRGSGWGEARGCVGTGFGGGPYAVDCAVV